ncbi:uncharacterized protein Z519_04926 [Cladophialophora bantiana CBS 173.52]|uniref:Uncharacterized protein n=1 Tax=Cladophialophora bantiana (strain ATCC 10958 / CBS 173.52 / CDC B-1940 / NIH 8579) TaxID=1442370 RepID=A0A0D2EYA8_CLAB1|nr:uncharacterized protein Z519_04926 [Cladophialophora bantiana CBS 173.52]KIW94946.1 hypothetical protein Z519_04926 [Cladophialophora bantiana CBS 173.52]
MAYASVAQAEHEAVYRESAATDSVHHPPHSYSPSRSPILPEISSPPLSLPLFDQFSRDGDLSMASQAGPSSVGVGSLLKSLSSSQSYQMVEEDDYEEPMPSYPEPLAPRLKMNGLPSAQNTPAFQKEDPPIRTASISRHLPLNHPTPDLQSLQGALVKNVERLEESAERLSMTSSLEDGLNKMKQDQKRLERQSSAPATLDNAFRPTIQRQFSTGSWSNSIIGVNQTARLGGYSPSGYHITSPTGSIRSGPWPPQQQHIERHSSKGSRRSHVLPPLEGRPLEFSPDRHASISIYPEDEVAPRASPRESEGSIQEERPTTSASNDTYRQAQAAFNDFDGVHYGSAPLSHEGAASISRRISLNHPPLARDSKAYKEPQPGERMIYYPAPVPVMLNLPPRLSKFNISERDKRRLQALSGIPDDVRKSAIWLGEQDTAKLQGQSNPLKLPPQLRASAFFEQPSVTQDLQLKNGSAVQTLDSILDAAAHAPVSAFTDHPIAGHLGKEVYGPDASPRKSMQLAEGKAKKRRSSLSTMLKTRRSSTALSGSGLVRSKSRGSQNLDGADQPSGDELDRAAAQSISPDADEISDEEEDKDVVPPGFSTAPTTLLAELQMRKEQQRLRNRTAADAFPNGMHSTLLELDAVTQLQQRARKTKHVTLAWEDHDEANKQNFDDEDVPLGVLFPEKDRADHANAHRPIGLLEKRELEDNEPLSHRRARLRGGPLQTAKSEAKGQIEEESRPPVIEDVPGLSQEPLPEDENETLAQRAARIKLEKEKGTGGQFTEELTSQLGLNLESDVLPPPSKTPDVEETLAQRRKRLKEEASTNPHTNQQLKPMHSLADLLQAHPVGTQPKPALPRTNSNYATHNAHWGYSQQNNVFNASYGYPNNVGYMNRGLGATLPSYMQQTYPYAYSNQPYIPDPMSGPPLDPKQRAQIDRWRQSIVQ